MKIPARQREGITILQPKGKITIGVGDVALREAVLETLDGGAKKVLIDLKDVTTVDSSGIGEMVSALTTATNRGAQLKLMNLPTKVNDILQITQLITVFDIYESEDEAAEAFD